jgi:hypothetical protein
MDIDTVVLAIVGIGLIVAVGLLVIELRKVVEETHESQENRSRVEIVSNPINPWLYPFGYGPYYSHVPIRPLLV